jgi:drug/metabolite transporter (DMT)-like permease
LFLSGARARLPLMFPYFTALIAVICYGAIGPILKKAGLNLPIFLLVGVASTLLAIGAFVILFVTEGRSGFFLPDRSKLGWLSIFAVINLLGWGLYMYSIRSIPVAQYDMIAGLGILVTAFFAALLLNEPLHLRYIPAAVLIMLGLYIAIGPEFRG